MRTYHMFDMLTSSIVDVRPSNTFYTEPAPIQHNIYAHIFHCRPSHIQHILYRMCAHRTQYMCAHVRLSMCARRTQHVRTCSAVDVRTHSHLHRPSSQLTSSMGKQLSDLIQSRVLSLIT